MTPSIIGIFVVFNRLLQALRTVVLMMPRKGHFNIGAYQKQLRENKQSAIHNVIRSKNQEVENLNKNILPALKLEESILGSRLDLLKKEAEVAINTLQAVSKVDY